MMPELGQWIHDYSDKMTFALISQGSAEINRAKVIEYGIAPVLLQQDREVAESYLVRATPSAVIIRTDGSIHSSIAEGEDQIRDLIKEETMDLSEVKPKNLPVLNVMGMPNETMFAAVGAPAPNVTLPDLDGQMIQLSDFLGSPTLMLFWSPDCGYCQDMLRNLKAWEAKPPKGAPQLYIISSGTATANKKQGLRSTVLLDEGFSIATLFGVKGTPSAVLVDENGIVIDKPSVGADEIWQLANSTARKYAKGKPKPATV
jgi:peroxiredoxin